MSAVPLLWFVIMGIIWCNFIKVGWAIHISVTLSKITRQINGVNVTYSLISSMHHNLILCRLQNCADRNIQFKHNLKNFTHRLRFLLYSCGKTHTNFTISDRMAIPVIRYQWITSKRNWYHHNKIKHIETVYIMAQTICVGVIYTWCGQSTTKSFHFDYRL